MKLNTLTLSKLDISTDTNFNGINLCSVEILKFNRNYLISA